MRRIVAISLASILLLVALMPSAWALIEVAIHEIQYTTDPTGASPLVGQAVTTGGLVTATYPDGFVLQEPLAGPWTGIYVADTIHRPPQGSFVVLSAQVAEEDGLTALTAVESLNVINLNNALPEPVRVSPADLLPGAPTAESFEGVLVSLTETTIASVDDAHNLWETRDAAGIGALVGNRAGYAFAPQVGNGLAWVRGVVFQGGGAHRIEPRGDGDIAPAAPQPSITGEVALERSAVREGVVVELSGLTAVAVSQADGSYALEAVPPGTYTIRAFATGYLTAERPGVQIMAGHVILLPALTLVGGDANGDNRVNISDLTIVASNFGQCPPADPWADINKDGCVNLSDLVLVTQNFGRVGPTAW